MKTQRVFLLLSLLLGFFALSPVFADDFSDDSTGRDDRQVYHISDRVDLISSQKIQYDKPRVVVRAVYPELQNRYEMQNFDEAPSSENPANEDLNDFNQRVANLISEEIDQFKTGITKTRDYQLSLPKSKVKNDLTIDYNAATMRSGSNQIVSVRFSIQGYITGMAHPYHHHRVLNYDLTNQRELSLSDLFTPDSNYLAILSDYTRKILLRRLSNQDMVTEGTSPTPEHFKIWNIKPNGLLITFDEYQVAPYVFGPQTVRVPFSVLKDLIPLTSPIGKCVRKKRCGGNNILTGGFIDQAMRKPAQFVL